MQAVSPDDWVQQIVLAPHFSRKLFKQVSSEILSLNP